MNSNLKIGISAKFHDKAPVFYGESKRHIQYLETSIASWIAKNNALPLMIPSESVDSGLDRRVLDAVGYAKEMDGLILQGGVDIHPSIYYKEFKGDTVFPTDIIRDKYELSLIKAFIQEKKPILGICRGLQLINVFFGGSIFTDLETQGFSKHLDKTTETKFCHEIKLAQDSVLSKIYSNNAKVISVHHQGIDKLGSDLKIEAYSIEDNLIEGISKIDNDHFILAVQWHPEFHPDTNLDFLDASKLLAMFLTVVKNRKFYGNLKVNKKKPVKFSTSSLLTLGTELELQLIDKNSMNLSPKSKNILDKLKDKTHKIKSEIYQSMIEIETDVCNNALEIEEDLKQSTLKLLEIADEQDVLIGSTGLHPFAHYTERLLTPSERYLSLVDSKQWIAKRISIFGLHCHVGVQSPQQGIELYRFYLSIAPLLLGLSASSPFYHGTQTGLESVRTTFFESTPSGGHPPIIQNWSEFEGLMSKLIKSKAIESHKDLWWDIRPSLNYGTIEIRICDSMPSIIDNAALVALIHLLGYAFLTEKDYNQWPRLAEWSYRENKWRALRYGANFDFIFNDAGNVTNSKEYLLNILENFDLLVAELKYEKFIDHIKKNMLNKTSAEKQIEVFKNTNSLEKVVENYTMEFRRGLI